MDLETYRKTFSRDDQPGAIAIDARIDAVHGPAAVNLNQETLIKAFMGGPDPIDRFIIRRVEDAPIPHLLYVSQGMSFLPYDEECAGKEFSKWGFEFAFRLAMDPADMPAAGEDVPAWPCNLMQNLARYVTQSGNWFDPGHFIPANGPIKGDDEATKMHGLAFAEDPKLGRIDTPHGEVIFLNAVGVTQSEIDAMFAKTYPCADLLAKLAEGNPDLTTSLARDADALPA